MEIVYLLVVLSLTMFVGLGVYLPILLISNKNKKNSKRKLIKKAICNKDENCSCCNGNCDKFIDGVLDGSKILDECPKITNEDKQEIKELLELEPKTSGNLVALVFCKGGARAVDQYGYVGPKKCEYSNKMFDGLKVCKFGCQGCMDCAKVCPTGAIKKNSAGVAEVERSLCIGCGECVKHCPDGLIGMVNLNQEIAITCRQASNPLIGGEVSEFCSVGCTKCEKCVKICPTKALYKDNGIIKFNKALCTKCGKCVNVCPNSTITNINKDFLNF